MAWLRERSEHWPEATLLHRARIVNHFLDFLVNEGLIASNPIADLRAQYNVKRRIPILQALLKPDPDQALESLRQLPPFGSVLGELMRNHIALMRNRGFRYETQARWFLRLIVSFSVIRNSPRSRFLSCCNAGQLRVPLQIMPLSANGLLVPSPRPSVTSIRASRPHAETRDHSSRLRSNGVALTSTALKKSNDSSTLLVRTHLRVRRCVQTVSIPCWSSPIVRVATERTFSPELRRCRSAIRHNHHSRDEVLQVQNPAIDQQCTWGGSRVSGTEAAGGRAAELRFRFILA